MTYEQILFANYCYQQFTIFLFCSQKPLAQCDADEPVDPLFGEECVIMEVLIPEIMSELPWGWFQWIWLTELNTI